MHMFLVGDSFDALAHVHPAPRTSKALDFDRPLPPLPAGHYRLYADIVHESGYAQTLVSAVDIPADRERQVEREGFSRASAAGDPDDSSFTGRAQPESAMPAFDLGDGTRIVWKRGDAPLAAGTERVLDFSLQDAAGAVVEVEPYMGMAAHIVVANRDGSVFAHLHPSGSISMAALQKFTAETPAGADPHAGHAMPLLGAVSVPYAFPKAGSYRLWVQMKRGGEVRTAAFELTVQ